MLILVNLLPYLLDLLKPILKQLRLHYKAAMILGRGFERRGSSRSPTLLNARSQSSLVAGIVNILRAICPSFGLVVRSCHQ